MAISGLALVGIKKYCFRIHIKFFISLSLGTKQRGETLLSEHSGGYDYEIGMQIPYMPSTRLPVKRFVWKSESNALFDRLPIRLQFKSFLKDGWLAEARHIDNDNQPDNLSLRLSYLMRIGDDSNSGKKRQFFLVACLSHLL